MQIDIDFRSYSLTRVEGKKLASHEKGRKTKKGITPAKANSTYPKIRPLSDTPNLLPSLGLKFDKEIDAS